MQDKKVYVQDKLLQQSALVWELVQQQGHIYVCGDAAAMAPTVEKTLIKIFKDQAVSSRCTSLASAILLGKDFASLRVAERCN